MPVLPVAPQSQPWITNRTDGETNTESCAFVTISPRRSALRTPPTPSLAAEVEIETSPSRPTTQKPSNEVIGGAFIGAFLGALLLIFLLRYCCGGGREPSEDGSTDSSLKSSKGPPPAPQPVYQVPPAPNNPTGGYAVPGVPNPKPIYPYTASRPVEHSRVSTQRPRGSITIAEVKGRPNWIRRNPRPRRPKPHSAAGSESTSSSSDRRRRRSSRRGDGVRIVELDVPRNLGYLHSAT